MGVMDPYKTAALKRLFLFRLRRLVELRLQCDCQITPNVTGAIDKAIVSTVSDCRQLGCGGDAAVLLAQVRGGQQ